MPTLTNDDTLRHLLILLCKRPWNEDLWGLVADRLYDLGAPERMVQDFRDSGPIARFRYWGALRVDCKKPRREIRRQLQFFRKVIVQMCGILEPSDEIPIPF